MSTPNDEQLALREAVGRFLDKEASAERVREAAAATGFDDRVWKGMVDLGLLEAAASGDASLGDLAIVAERWGSHLAPAPFVEAAIAARVLGRANDGVTVFAARPATDGVAPLVPGGAVATTVVALDDDRLVAATLTDDDRTARRGLGDRALADCSLRNAEVLATGPDAIARFDRALDEWRALQSVALAGMARAALDLAVQYVKDRHQFGVPIGSFQTIQHRLADLHTEVEGATLLAAEVVEAIDANDPDAPVLAAMAHWWCGRTAEAAAAGSLHFHGGYGFMLEYDVQLYVRHAKAWRLALGDPRRELAVIAERLWADGTRSALDRPLDDQTEAFRQEVRQFIAANLTDDIIERAHATGTMHDWGFHRALCERGYLAAGWPEAVGGQGRSAIETTALMQELFSAGAPVDGMSIAAMVGATLLVCGTDEQKADILPGILRGETMCCLGYSEPDAGSDVAAVQTRAVRDGDEWIVNGQKMFTTMAHEAQYVFLLTRTSPDKPKHKGLTMFLVPMDSSGIEITPVETLGGERTNITFYTDVRVPDTCRIGDVDAGWTVMHAALVYERNSANWGEPARLVRLVAEWAQRTGAIEDPLVRDRLAEHATAIEVGRTLLYRTAVLAADGAMSHVEGSMTKLFITEAFTRAATDLLDAVGADGILPHGEQGAPLSGLVEHAYRHSTVTTIYGGSSEVQRGIIAEQGLGLPRTR